MSEITTTSTKTPKSTTIHPFWMDWSPTKQTTEQSVWKNEMLSIFQIIDEDVNDDSRTNSSQKHTDSIENVTPTKDLVVNSSTVNVNCDVDAGGGDDSFLGTGKRYRISNSIGIEFNCLRVFSTNPSFLNGNFCSEIRTILYLRNFVIAYKLLLMVSFRQINLLFADMYESLYIVLCMYLYFVSCFHVGFCIELCVQNNFYYYVVMPMICSPTENHRILQRQ